MLWISPELLRSGNLRGSKEADIYSFGMVCSELVNNEVVWHDPRDEKAVEGFSNAANFVDNNLVLSFFRHFAQSTKLIKNVAISSAIDESRRY